MSCEQSNTLITVDGVTYTVAQVAARLRLLQHIIKQTNIDVKYWVCRTTFKMLLPDIDNLELAVADDDNSMDVRETKENSL